LFSSEQPRPKGRGFGLCPLGEASASVLIHRLKPEASAPRLFSEGSRNKSFGLAAAAMQFFNSKGQGATEYLVLLAVVLIIGIVTTALLGFFPGLSGDISENEARLYWQSAASPFRIMDASGTANGAPPCSASDTTNTALFSLVLENSDPNTMTITNVRIDGTARSFCLPGASTYAPSISFSGGERKTMLVWVPSSSCTAGKTVSPQVAIIYSTPYLTGKVQNGTKRMVFKCN